MPTNAEKRLKLRQIYRNITHHENVLRSGWVCFFIRFGEMCHCISEWVPSEWESIDALQWMGAVRMRVNGCSAVNGCRQNENQWMLCSERVPSEWESTDVQMLTDGLMFLSDSFWRHPFTDAVTHFSKTNSSWSLMTCDWTHSQHVFIFGRTIANNVCKQSTLYYRV